MLSRFNLAPLFLMETKSKDCFLSRTHGYWTVSTGVLQMSPILNIL